MAAAYLNNALYAPEVSEPQGAFPHIRNLSTVSSATLHTSTTLHSPPTEPLLPPSAPGAEGYYEVLSRQSRSSVPLRWDQSTAVDGTLLKGESQGLWGRVTQVKLSRWKWLKAGLEAVIGIWSLYNTIRYFYAFTIYESPAGQSYSLALGTSTGLSFACLACAVILALAEPALSLHGIAFRRLLSARQWLHYISSFLLTVPAIINFAAVFSWRNATDPQLMTAHRCHVDIDIIWSTSYTLCDLKSPSWGVWLTLSVLRLFVTLVLLLAHLKISSIFYRLKNLGNPRRTRKHKYHPSDSFHTPCLPHHMTGPLLLPHFEGDTRKPESTLSARSKTSSSPQNQVRLVRSRSSGLSSGDVIFDPTSLYSTPANPSFNLPEQGSDTNDRFRLLVAQYTRETEEAIESARSEDTSSRHTLESPPPNNKDPNDANLQPSAGLPDDRDDDEGHGEHHDNDDIYQTRPPSALGYNEFGMPYPADQQIRMLNGYIRRMPTIESMGSREMGSSIAASSLYTNRDRERERYSMNTNSRPPTRNNRSSWDSEAPSRTNSLSAKAEILAGLTSEVGELLRMEENRAELSRSRPASLGVGEYSAGSGASHGSGHDDYSSSTSGSRNTTLSYHTASMGSTTSVTPVAVEVTPPWPPS